MLKCCADYLGEIMRYLDQQLNDELAVFQLNRYYIEQMLELYA